MSKDEIERKPEKFFLETEPRTCPLLEAALRLCTILGKPAEQVVVEISNLWEGFLHSYEDEIKEEHRVYHTEGTWERQIESKIDRAQIYYSFLGIEIPFWDILDISEKRFLVKRKLQEAISKWGVDIDKFKEIRGRFDKTLDTAERLLDFICKYPQPESPCPLVEAFYKLLLNCTRGLYRIFQRIEEVLSKLKGWLGKVDTLPESDLPYYYSQAEKYLEKPYPDWGSKYDKCASIEHSLERAMRA